MNQNNGLTFIERLSASSNEKSEDYVPESYFPIIESIKDNLQALLNSQKIVFSWDENSPDLQRSILNYGLDSLQGFLYDSYQSAEILCIEIENTIKTFEMRLQQVKVSMQKSEIADHLLFFVEGIFVEDFEKFEVQFQTKLNLDNCKFITTMKNLERV